MSNPGSLGNTTKVLDAVAGGIVGIAIGSIRWIGFADCVYEIRKSI